MDIKREHLNEIKRFNEKMYSDLNEIIKILNKKYNFKLYSVIFDDEMKNYYTSLRIKKTVSIDHKMNFEVNQVEIKDINSVFSDLSISPTYKIENFTDSILKYFNETLPMENKRNVNNQEIPDEKNIVEETNLVNKSDINNIFNRLLYINSFGITISTNSYRVAFILEMRNLDTETLNIFYDKPYCSFLRLILDWFFGDYYYFNEKGNIVLSKNNILDNKYKEDYINFVRRLSRIFFGKIINSINQCGQTRDAYKEYLNKLDSSFYINNIIEKLNDISDRTYENANPFGSILFLNKDTVYNKDLIDYAIKFQDDNKITLENSKMIRKLLEMTNKEKGLYLISDCYSILGLGQVKWDQVQNTVLFRVDFNGISKYSLYYVCVHEKENDKGNIDYSGDYKLYKYTTNLEIVEKKLINLIFKNPRIEDDFAPERFRSILKKELYSDLNDNCNNIYIDKIVKIVNRAREQKHGTMVVIAKEEVAVNELKNLKKQATMIDAMEIEPTYIKFLTSIDGAIYLDSYAKCHAVGVILDGLSNENIGDSSRGARYNSAYKYFNKLKGKNCVIVIISEDGMVDVIPEISDEETIFGLTQEIIDLINEENESSSELLKQKEQILKSNNSITIDYIIYFKIGDEFYNKANYEKAYEYYKNGIEIAKKQLNVIPWKLYLSIAYSCIAVGIAEEKNKDFDNARLKYIETIKYYDDYILNYTEETIQPYAYNNRGVAKDRLGSINKKDDLTLEAVNDFTEAINLQAKSPSLLYYENRSKSYRKLKKYKEEMHDLIKCSLLSDDDKTTDEFIKSIKGILKRDKELIEICVNSYKEALSELGKNEIKSLNDMLEEFIPKNNDSISEAASGNEIE